MSQWKTALTQATKQDSAMTGGFAAGEPTSVNAHMNKNTAGPTTSHGVPVNDGSGISAYGHTLGSGMPHPDGRFLDPNAINAGETPFLDLANQQRADYEKRFGNLSSKALQMARRTSNDREQAGGKANADVMQSRSKAIDGQLRSRMLASGGTPAVAAGDMKAGGGMLAAAKQAAHDRVRSEQDQGFLAGINHGQQVSDLSQIGMRAAQKYKDADKYNATQFNNAENGMFMDAAGALAGSAHTSDNQGWWDKSKTWLEDHFTSAGRDWLRAQDESYWHFPTAENP